MEVAPSHWCAHGFQVDGLVNQLAPMCSRFHLFMREFEQSRKVNKLDSWHFCNMLNYISVDNKI